MKYLKLFENINKYNIGDYVLIDVDKISVETEQIEYAFGVNWKDNDISVYIYDVDPKFIYPYSVLSYNNKKTLISSDEIKRKLTQDEIDDFIMKQNSIKYNL